MSQHLLFALLCCGPLAAAAAPQDETAYSIGVSLGQRLQQEVPPGALPDLLEGLRQGYRGEALALPRERIDALLAAHERQVQQQNEQASSEDAARLAERRFLVREKVRYGVHELNGGVLVSELRSGHGAIAPDAREVQVSYAGQLADGTPFDASDKPQWFRLDAVIPGWRTALAAMPVGAKWRVVIPSAQAYGAQGAGGVIPPYAALVFEIELLGSR